MVAQTLNTIEGKASLADILFQELFSKRRTTSKQLFWHISLKNTQTTKRHPNYKKTPKLSENPESWTPRMILWPLGHPDYPDTQTTQTPRLPKIHRLDLSRTSEIRFLATFGQTSDSRPQKVRDLSGTWPHPDPRRSGTCPRSDPRRRKVRDLSGT